MAGPPSFTTTDLFNGRMWQLLSGTQKISHLTGIQEGIILCLNQIKEDMKITSDLMKSMQDSGIFDRRRLLFSSQGVTGIETGMDHFYEDSANLDIPIIDAYQHITLALNFATPEESDGLNTCWKTCGPTPVPDTMSEKRSLSSAAQVTGLTDPNT